jgi:hypothetical protein
MCMWLMSLMVLSLGGAVAGCGGSSNSSDAPTLQRIKVTPTPFSTGIGIARQLTATGTYGSHHIERDVAERRHFSGDRDKRGRNRRRTGLDNSQRWPRDREYQSPS